MDKSLTLAKTLLEAETYTQMTTITGDRIASPIMGTSVNKATAGRGGNSGRGRGKGGQGRGSGG